MKKLLLILIALPMIGFGQCISGDCENGQGTYTFQGEWEGDKYSGEWKSGKRDGRGTYTYANGELEGDKYFGDYKDNKKHGKGTFTNTDGTVYKGLFKDDKYVGE